MKKILLLTDFSANATCAAEAALVLSGKLHTDLLLFNTYIDYAMMPYYGGGGWIVDEVTERNKKSRQGLELLIEGLESLSNETGPEIHKPVISFDYNNCNLEMGVADILHANKIELIVMGARSHDQREALYGEDTKSIINHATCPVLIVPEKTDLKQIRKVVFATDFDEEGFKAIHYLMKLGKLFNYQLEIIHVNKPDKQSTARRQKALVFQEQLAQLNYQGLTYHELDGNDTIYTLNHFETETGPVLFALLHHQHSYFVRPFVRSETKKALVTQKVPLLVFPTKMTNT